MPKIEEIETLPTSDEAERLVVGNALIRPEIASLVASLTADHFTDEKLVKIVGAIQDDLEDGLEPTAHSVADRLGVASAGLDALAEAAMRLADKELDACVRILREKRRRRELAKIGSRLVGNATSSEETSADLNSRAIRELSALMVADDDLWGELQPIPSTLPPVPPLDPALLPIALRPAAEDVAERMQVPLDFSGAALVVALAAITGRGVEIQPKQRDNLWRVVPNLFGAVVAPPGFMKSPVIHEITRPLREIEDRWLLEYKENYASQERKEAEYKLAVDAWRKSYMAAQTRPNATVAEHPGEAPQPPARRRIIVNDSTVERLHMIMAENPKGVLVLRDELVGWLASMDRRGNEGARQFHLEAWNGNGYYQVDRIGRGNVGAVLCESVFGGIQPSKLRAYVLQFVPGLSGDDGLIQRFQVIVWPDAPAKWRLVDRPPDHEALSRVRRVFAKVAELEPDAGNVLRFDAEAQQLFYEWLETLEYRIRGDEIHQVMASHLSKYRSLMPSLAGLFALADWAALEGNQPLPEIGIEHAKRAAAWCDYLEAHAARVYSCVISGQWTRAADLARKLKAGKLGGRFALRDLYFRGWSGLATVAEAREACEALVELGWLRRLPSDPGPKGGRPSEEFLVHPEVRQ